MLFGMQLFRGCLVAMALLFYGGLAQAQTLSLAGIAHVAIRTSDLARSIDFYQKLGFEQAFAFSKDGVPTESFLKVNDRQFIEVYPSQAAAGFMHVCFAGSDLAALNRSYLALGLAPTAVKRAGAGNLLFTMVGPEQQNIEYTQYMPGSLHSNDQGKHLGGHRIADQMVGVRIPMQDPSAGQTFYAQKLGFHAAGHELALPGAPGQTVEFGSPFQIILAVRNLRAAAAQLAALQLPAANRRSRLTIHDPDGNEIVLIKFQAGNEDPH